MNSEIKRCQNCKQEFRIEPEDFVFYEKMKVPPPTFCPECRFKRRLVFFNLTTLYRRTCDLCKKESLSIYTPEAPYKVYCPHCWWSDKWDAFEYGRDYDFSKPFFKQFDELLHEVPMLGLSIDLPTISGPAYINIAGHLKNCYLLFSADGNENCAYGVYVNHCKDVFDSSLIYQCELCYDSMHSYKNSRCVGLRSQVTESIDCAFLRDCRNCQNCFASANLRNKQYYIFNKPYSKDEYFEEIKKWDLGSYKAYQEIKKLAEKHWATMVPKSVFDELSVNSSGGFVFQSKNCKECYEVGGAEDSKFLFLMTDPPIKDCYDISYWGNNISMSYECCMVGENSARLLFTKESGLSQLGAEYCNLVLGGSNYFGCVSIRKGRYCILNKRYSKEDYEALRAKIVEHMDAMPYIDKKGRVYRYGEFFPVELSPHAYNETLTQNFFPLSKETAEEQGYRWRDEDEIRQYTVTAPYDKLPDHIRDVSDSILKEVVGCKRCGRGFKIIPQELAFLREQNLPLPRECPFCRINEKFDLWVKNLRQIPRVCNKCGKEFKTKYTQEEAPTIYCKECYLQEVV